MDKKLTIQISYPRKTVMDILAKISMLSLSGKHEEAEKLQAELYHNIVCSHIFRSMKFKGIE